jgi:hypothetical protein
MYFKKVGCENMNLIRLAEVRDQMQAVVNTVMNFGVP